MAPAADDAKARAPASSEGRAGLQLHAQPEQLSLGLDLPTVYRASDFLTSPCNRIARAWIDRWPDWPATALLVHGPPGAGKTHLARIFADQAGARILSGESLAAALDPPSWTLWRAHVVEHADRMTDEETLLHLYNGTRETGGHLLLTSRWPLSAWALDLPDLRSRLRTAPVVGIDTPDDALLAALLVKLFDDRQLRVDEAVVLYLVQRMERSFAEARRVVAALDDLALRTRRRIGIALAREALGWREI